MSNSKSSPESAVVTQKYLDKILKLQQNQDDTLKQEYDLLRAYIGQTNILLAQVMQQTKDSDTYLVDKRSVPYASGIRLVSEVQLTIPQNDNDYAVILDIYATNGMKPIPHMNLANEGPGNVYFKAAYAKNTISSNEVELRPNEVRVLYNVYEIRLRVDQYLTGYRLIEEEIRTGSLSPLGKNYIEVRPILAANEKLKVFSALFDNQYPIISIHQPLPIQNIHVDYNLPAFQVPLLPGHVATLVDFETGICMPYTILQGSILEAFSIMTNLSTNTSIRIYIESDPILSPGTYTLVYNFPISQRGMPFQLQLNLSQITTQNFDPNGAPPTGRRVIVTITNDDQFDPTLGEFSFTAILRRLT